MPVFARWQASLNYSVQPHGVFFNKSNEGSRYKDRTSGAQKADDIVRPGQTYTYRWTVPKEVGPTEADAQCVTWLYSSSVDPVKDTYAGGSIFTVKETSVVFGKSPLKPEEFPILNIQSITSASTHEYAESNRPRIAPA